MRLGIGPSFPRSRLCRNSKKRLIRACHAGLDPASRNVSAWNCTGFRVKPGMTKKRYLPFCQLRHSLASGNPGVFELDSRLRGSDIHFVTYLCDTTLNAFYDLKKPGTWVMRSAGIEAWSGSDFNNISREENAYMGKGDRRTKRGKLFRKSYGVKRPRKKKPKTDQKNRRG